MINVKIYCAPNDLIYPGTELRIVDGTGGMPPEPNEGQ